METGYKNVWDENALGRLHEAYTGEKRTLKAKHCLLWFRDGKVRAGFIDHLPKSLAFENRNYNLLDVYVGDWEPLLTDEGNLAGFVFLGFLQLEEDLLKSRLLTQSSNVQIDGTMIEIRLLENVESDVKGSIAAMGTRVYQDEMGEFIFCLPQWTEWGENIFNIETENIPFSRL